MGRLIDRRPAVLDRESNVVLSASHMEMIPHHILATWAAGQPKVIALYVFGSRARGDARPDSDLDLAFELDESWDNDLTVLMDNRERWRRELSACTGLVVHDLHLRRDPEVSDPVVEIYRGTERQVP